MFNQYFIDTSEMIGRFKKYIMLELDTQAPPAKEVPGNYLFYSDCYGAHVLVEPLRIGDCNAVLAKLCINDPTPIGTAFGIVFYQKRFDFKYPDETYLFDSLKSGEIAKKVKEILG